MNTFLRRYWLPLLLVIVGSIVALCGVGTATVWKPSPQVSASLPSSSQKQNLAITRPGMFELYNSATKITVSGQGKVALAIGRSADVSAWAADLNYVEVTGQKDKTTLLTEPHRGKADSRQPGEAAGRDMWLKYKEADGGQISETWNRSEGAWSVIAWSEEGNVQLTMQWTQAVSTPWFWPLLVAGVLLILVGAIVAVVIFRFAKAAAKEEEQVREQRKLRAEQAPDSQTEQTVQMPSLQTVAHPPSRSDLRKARERGEETIEVEGVKFPTGLVPVVRTDEDGNPINPLAATSAEPEISVPKIAAPVMVADDSSSSEPMATETRPVNQVGADKLSSASASQLPAESFAYTQGAQPVISDNSAQSYQPEQSFQPEASFNPAQSYQPEQSFQPDASYNPAQSYEPAQPYEPAQSIEPAQPYPVEQAAQSYQPEQSFQPEASFNPAQSYQPEQSFQPDASYNPAQSYEPAQPYEPAQSIEPAQPYEPTSSPINTGEWFEDDNFDLDGLGEGPDIDDFEGESTFEQSQGGSN